MPEETYLVKIGSVVFSDDGTDDGNPCLTEVENLDQLFLDHEGSTVIPITGRAFNFLRPRSGTNVRLLTRPFVVTLSVLEDLRTIINAADASGNAIQVEISGGPGSKILAVDPLWEPGRPPIGFKKFFDDETETFMYETEIRLITRSIVDEDFEGPPPGDGGDVGGDG